MANITITSMRKEKDVLVMRTSGVVCVTASSCCCSTRTARTTFPMGAFQHSTATVRALLVSGRTATSPKTTHHSEHHTPGAKACNALVTCHGSWIRPSLWTGTGVHVWLGNSCGVTLVMGHKAPRHRLKQRKGREACAYGTGGWRGQE